ncbi:hypothetical protein TraAM80_06777 [Trypanosoma rangeli]|uniref:Uncharacterized protein n=1 Tax=Trypanosoma rangeli TaxID=5698 RepID=A0A3R7K8N9_TRYRA|nr:uncharacterized protein TraAM80_06777 [Trypanosoma rangeli]RNF01778.1 hypothetical protein TraAM80_06777 [Trypanosoma rangeli]|eukprot:RNF01778.1 hypothetical protein TraAM80_06777 [Trypanosoma rangeli]
MPSCVFCRHEVPDKSEYMCACTELTEIRHVLGLQEKQTITSNAAASVPSIHPASLALRESVSMTLSHADYTSLTRCHTVERLTKDQVTLFWEHAAMFAAEHILNAASGSLRRGTPVMGVFITRNAPADFTVGLITQGTLRDQRLQDALAQFSSPHALARVHAELPLCAAHRAATLRLWWEPRAERVTPHRVMPPMKVILEQQQEHQYQQQGQLDETHLCGYVAVNVFLCRPAASQLCGSTRKLLNDAVAATFEKTTTHAADKISSRRKKKAAAFVVDDPHGAARSREQEQWRRTVVLHFDDLFVLEEGEHLIGVEVERLPSYKAFVPALYGHLAPFLVVAHEDA